MLLGTLFLVITLLTEETLTQTLVISNAIKQFRDYSPAIHYDNETYRDNFNCIYELRNVDKYLVNHDLNHSISMPNDKKFLHIVFLENVSYLENYIFTGKNFSYRDVVLTIIKTETTRRQLTNACKQRDLYRTSGVYLYETINNTIYCCWYFYGKKYVYLRKIDMEGERVPQLRNYLNKYANFDGYSFRIGYAVYEPFFYCDFSGDDNKCIARGAEYQIIKTLSEQLNFRYEFYGYDPGTERGAWADMMYAVYRGNIDWAVSGISQSVARSKYLAYTRYINFDGYIALFMAYENQWLTTVQCLRTISSNWMSNTALILSVIGIALLTKFYLKIHEMHSDSTAAYIMMMVAYLIEQHSPRLETRIHFWKPYIKALFVVWWFVCLTQIIYYRTLQTYYLIGVPVAPTQVEDLIEDGFQFEINIEDYPFLRGNCQNATSMACQIIIQTINVTTNEYNSISNVANKKVAYIQETLPMKYLVVKKSGLPRYQRVNLRSVTINFMTNQWHAWPMEKDCPFARTFSQIISRLEAGGIVSYWYHKELNFLRYRVKKNQILLKEENSLNLHSFSFAFVVLVAGYAISTIAYLIEMSIFKSKVPMPNHQQGLLTLHDIGY